MSCNRIFAIVFIPVCLCLFSSKAACKLRYEDLHPLDQRELLTTLIRYCDDTLAKLPAANAGNELDRLSKLGHREDFPLLSAAAAIVRARYLADHNPDDSAAIFRTLKAGLNIALDNHLAVIAAYGQYQLGNAYYQRNRFAEGIEELLNANEALKDVGYGQMPEAAGYLLSLGSMYCDYQEYEKAIKCLIPALKLANGNTAEKYNILGTMGLALYRLNRTDSSIYYSNQALSVARRLGDTMMVGSMSGNIGIAYLQKKNYPLALQYLDADYQTSKHYAQDQNATRAKLIIAKVYFEQGDLDGAVRTLDTVQRMIALREGSVNIYWELYNLLAKIHLRKKEYYKAAIYQDSFIRYDAAYRLKTASTIVRGLELKVSSEIHETRIRLLDSEKKRQILLRNALIVSSLLTIIIIVQVLYRFRQKQKAERKIFALTLDNAEKKLATYIQSLREKNNLLEQFEAELEQVKASRMPAGNPTGVAEMEDILARIHGATLITEEGWNEFAGLVNIVHKNFFIRLRQIYPDLTPAETRLLTLIKLQFSTREMAAMLGISQDSVKKARQRARKKFNIPDTEDLYEVLRDI